VSVKLTARRRDFNAGWDAHAALTKDVKDVIEAYKRLCDAKRRRGKQKAHEDWDCTIQTLEINLEAALDRLVEQDKQDG
jgi:hypothetical protein